MGKWLMRLDVTVLAISVLVMAGCQPKKAEEPAKGPVPANSVPPVVARDTEKPAEKEPIPIEVSDTLESLTPKRTSIPEVKLPETLKETCLVTVGDAMPDGEVATTDGEKKAVADMFGKAGTIVFFWAAGSSEIAQKTAAQALADLQGDAMDAYGDKGLAVVAIDPKDPPEKVKELVGTVKVAFPILVDAGGTYFAKVASDRLPRVYVLDASGKIVWFDVEFSEVTRETLKQTLNVMLGEPQSAKN